SNEVLSNQQGVHENLESIVRKHFETEYKKPIAEHTQVAFDKVKNRVETALKKDTPLLFDSFCGTGVSTGIIAKNNPQALVIGIDRSIARLSKKYNKELPENAVLVQAECADFWLLAKQAGWQLAKHTIYYPNPYPKAKHIKRRWHAHPAYPLLFALGGEVELRTNWKIYADEFSQAFFYASSYLKDSKLSCKGVETISFDVTTNDSEKIITEFMTLFERKYFLNGQKLYRCKLVF
ncbi:MAG: hypothetical protein V7749_04630, partial [Cocleimonas sp.]